MQQDIEIERQFKLLRPASEIIAEAERNGSLLLSSEIHQSYLAYTGNWTVRARKTGFGGRLTPVFSGRRMTPTFEQTLKCRAEGIARTEVSINLDENGYRRLARQCGPVLWKRRTEISLGDRIWEIDVFLNPALLGLELVEVELPSEDASLVLPDWVGEETTYLPQYRNAELAKRLPADEERQ